ncbi:MAG: hypothetical protein U0869_05555 [Chloroflexota bacterium]
MASLPRVATVVVYISAQQPMRQGAWHWGPTWRLPSGLNGAWAINESKNVAVRCENVEGLAVRTTDAFERMLENAMNAEAIAERDAYLRAQLHAEMSPAPTVDQAGKPAAAPKRRRRKATLAVVVQEQLAEILRSA